MAGLIIVIVTHESRADCSCARLPGRLWAGWSGAAQVEWFLCSTRVLIPQQAGLPLCTWWSGRDPRKPSAACKPSWGPDPELRRHWFCCILFAEASQRPDGASHPGRGDETLCECVGKALRPVCSRSTSPSTLPSRTFADHFNESQSVEKSN